MRWFVQKHLTEVFAQCDATRQNPGSSNELHTKLEELFPDSSPSVIRLWTVDTQVTVWQHLQSAWMSQEGQELDWDKHSFTLSTTAVLDTQKLYMVGKLRISAMRW